MRIKMQALLALGTLTSVALIAPTHAGAGRELLFSAPVQQIDTGADKVTVLGLQFHANTAKLSIGEIVNVYGLLHKDGSIADTVVQGTQSFGANGDPVFLKGVVTDVDAALGRAKVDGLTIDYTSQLANSAFTVPSIGDVISIAGSQPAAKGVLVATATGDSAYEAGVNLEGTRVDGFAAVAGSNTAHGTGTGLAGMSGGGTSSAGMSGGGTNSAGMSGGGLGSAGMSGGGTNSAGMSGGGRSSAGMSGGGLAAAGMSGGGISSAGMSGGGTNSAGMSGGGNSAAGMSGGGTSSAGMSGGGVKAAGMSGGGRF
jgi:hypothetical protein